MRKKGNSDGVDEGKPTVAEKQTVWQSAAAEYGFGNHNRSYILRQFFFDSIFVFLFHNTQGIVFPCYDILYSQATRFSFPHSTCCPIMRPALCGNWKILSLVSITLVSIILCIEILCVNILVYFCSSAAQGHSVRPAASPFYAVALPAACQ